MLPSVAIRDVAGREATAALEIRVGGSRLAGVERDPGVEGPVEVLHDERVARMGREGAATMSPCANSSKSIVRAATGVAAPSRRASRTGTERNMRTSAENAQLGPPVPRALPRHACSGALTARKAQNYPRMYRLHSRELPRRDASLRLNEVRHAERGPTRPLDGRARARGGADAGAAVRHAAARASGRRRREGGASDRGESGRGSRPQIVDRDGRKVGATYLRNNLGKRSIGIDLKAPARRRAGAPARAALRRARRELQARGDGAHGARLRRARGAAPAARLRVDLGLRAPRADARTPTGPPTLRSWRRWRACTSRSGGPGEPPPVVVAGALGDNASALYALIGMLAALRQRDRTGRGQHVDISMFDAMIAMTDMVPFMWSLGEPPSAATAGRTGLVAAFAASDGYFVDRDPARSPVRAARAARRPARAGAAIRASPRARAGRSTARAVVRPAVEAWARDKTKLEASRRLAAEGIPAGPEQPRARSVRRSARRRARHADRGAAPGRRAPDARGRESGEALRRARGPALAHSRRSASTPRPCCAKRSRSTTRELAALRRDRRDLAREEAHAALRGRAVARASPTLPGWSLAAGKLHREFRFPDFVRAFAS